MVSTFLEILSKGALQPMRLKGNIQTAGVQNSYRSAGQVAGSKKPPKNTKKSEK